MACNSAGSPKKKSGCLAQIVALIVIIVVVNIFRAVFSGSESSQKTASVSGDTVIKTEPTPEQKAQAAERKAKRETEVKQEHDSISAYTAAEDICKEHLKSPRTAKFSSFVWDSDKTGCRMIDTNQWFAYGFVDSQNSFGAMLRENWIAVVDKKSERFSVSYLQVGEQSMGNPPEILKQLGISK